MYILWSQWCQEKEREKKSNEWKLATQNGLISILRWGREDIN